ncbi:heterocyst development glycosyltransferase HepC [Leptolyngbya sp. KIOST-1]|uniref:heterocyst development glycosyltransferase HepC n=1 Tax=Leptolyngbya sp. KIOST-1 TaxID=1229172 RepID=UPI00399D5FB4
MSNLTLQPQTLPSAVSNHTLCRLLWRQGKLWVLPPATSTRQIALPALAHPKWFQLCLERSKTMAVVIDPNLGSEVINFWAEACEKAGKPLYLRLPTTRTLPNKKNVWAWRTKCLVERLVGLVLLVLLSPLMLVFASGLMLQDGGPACNRHWCIGQRGRVFRMAQFRRESLLTGQKTRLGQWLELSRLDRLPRLVNVVRGEMALIGTKPWIVEEAIKVPPEFQFCLNALPGTVGPRPLGLNIPTLDIRAICQQEVAYLKNWTLWRDSQTGLLAVVQMLTGQEGN